MHKLTSLQPSARDFFNCFCEAVTLCDSLVQTTSRKKERKNPRYFMSWHKHNLEVRPMYRTEVRMRTAISHDPSSK